MAKTKEREKEYIIVNGKKYELIKKSYDWVYECYYYYVKEQDEPFCDLNDDIKIVHEKWGKRK